MASTQPIAVALVAAVLALGAGCGAQPGPLASPAPAPAVSETPTDPSGSPGPPGSLDQTIDRITGGRPETEVPNLGGLSVDEQQGVLDVYWVGSPPAGLAELVAHPPPGLTVRFHAAPYDVARLDKAVVRLFNTYGRYLHAGGPQPDGTGLFVEQTAAERAKGPTVARMSEVAGVPVRSVISEAAVPLRR